MRHDLETTVSMQYCSVGIKIDSMRAINFLSNVSDTFASLCGCNLLAPMFRGSFNTVHLYEVKTDSMHAIKLSGLRLEIE